MKHIRLFLFAILAIVCMGCEKKHQDPIVTVTHEIGADNKITFTATSQNEPVIMFYWYVRCNGAEIYRGVGKSLADYNGDQDWEFLNSDAVTVQGESGKTYSATICYYDYKYDEHLKSSEEVTLP